MKKLMVFLLSSIFLFFLILINFVSAIRINEVMADPSTSQCSDDKCEYIEIYTNKPINLTNWTLNTGEGNIYFSCYLEDYLIITMNKTIFLTSFSVNESKVIEKKISLRNSNDSVLIYNNLELISNFTYWNSTSGKSWQFCNNSWIEAMPTPGLINSCTQQPQNNTQQNSPQNQNQNDDTPTQEEIYLKLDWDEDDIINGKKFEIEVSAFNLKNENYDIKIYIKPEDEETVLSEVYDEKEDKWLSGNYYVDEIISGSGEKEEMFSLRIKSKYSNFSGDAEIVAKIRKSGTSFVIDEAKEDAEVLEKEEKNYDKNNTKSSELKTNNAKEDTPSTSSMTGEVIKLGNRQAEEEVIYESRSEKIKKYSIYGLNLVLVIIILLLMMNKKVLKPEKQE